MTGILWLTAFAIVLRYGTQLVLALLNAGEVRRNRAQIPEVFRGMMDEEAYRKSVDYTLARSRFGIIDETWDTAILVAVVFSGVLPGAWNAWVGMAGAAPWASALFLILFLIALSIPGLPIDWWSTFKLEQKFGFNRSTLGLWISDKLKGSLIAVAIGFPLIWVLLKLVEWMGTYWWLAGWAVFMGVQVLMMVVYPMWILPLFNKLTPLEPGDLRERLLALAERANFNASNVQVMDGSKRSGHSNAFFTGFGRLRRIVLFDTLIEQLETEELEAVLAHEIGHYKLGHVVRMICVSAVLTLGGFWVVGWLVRTPEFFEAFGFSEPQVVVAFLLFMLLGGVFGFWLGPVANWMSRRHEYQADAFAGKMMNGAASLLAALRKLSKENLSNLTPHPVFSTFYYSHPTLAEREAALRNSS
jgi:STE24 endopeptidase